MVAARHLHNWGADVRVGLTRPVATLIETIKMQAKILQEMGIPLGIFGEIELHNLPNLILDGIIGYSIQGSPRGLAADMINWANGQNTQILALDLPSGLHGTTGEVMEPAIRASATMTLALPKIGLQMATEDIIGELYLADIGVPPVLYTRSPLNLSVGTIFNQDPILRIK
jgi:NAD(P)H-hydrate epimerase